VLAYISKYRPESGRQKKRTLCPNTLKAEKLSKDATKKSFEPSAVLSAGRLPPLTLEHHCKEKLVMNCRSSKKSLPFLKTRSPEQLAGASFLFIYLERAELTTFKTVEYSCKNPWIYFLFKIVRQILGARIVSSCHIAVCILSPMKAIRILRLILS